MHRQHSLSDINHWFKQIPREGNLIDVGSGTGQTAQAMRDLFGFRGPMDGIEGSENMVAIARRKNIYRDIFVEFIDESIQSALPKDYYVGRIVLRCVKVRKNVSLRSGRL